MGKRKKVVKKNSDSESFPDGGLRAWLVVLGAFFWTICVSVFQEYYETHQLISLSPCTISWIPSLSMFTIFIAGPFVGHLFDHYGPEMLLLFGITIHVFGLMMASISSKYYQFIYLNRYTFQKRRALAMGIVASGSSMGGVVLPIMINHLIPTIGFGWTMRICAFLMLGLLVMNAFTFLVNYGRSVGMSPQIAGYLVSTFNGASGIVGNFNISLCAACLSTTLVFALWLPSHSNSTTMAFASLFGFSSGTYTAISLALVAQISDIHEIGLRSGTMYAFMSVAALTGSPIGGALITAANRSSTGSMFYGASRLYLAKGKLLAKV
ncbi:MFS general substrate transporter [Trichoderma austrokoningii]